MEQQQEKTLPPASEENNSAKIIEETKKTGGKRKKRNRNRNRNRKKLNLKKNSAQSDPIPNASIDRINPEQFQQGYAMGRALASQFFQNPNSTSSNFSINLDQNLDQTPKRGSNI